MPHALWQAQRHQGAHSQEPVWPHGVCVFFPPAPRWEQGKDSKARGPCGACRPCIYLGLLVLGQCWHAGSVAVTVRSPQQHLCPRLWEVRGGEGDHSTVSSAAISWFPWPSIHQDKQSCLVRAGQQTVAFLGDEYKEISPSVLQNGRRSPGSRGLQSPADGTANLLTPM